MAKVPTARDAPEVQMVTRLVVRPYRGTSTWEADVTMLAGGRELRRRWRSPMPSRTATERWAREKAKAYLARPAVEAEEELVPTAPLFRDFAERWIEEYVVANRHSPATVSVRRKVLSAHLVPLLGELRLDEIGVPQFQTIKAARTALAQSTLNQVTGQLTTMLRVAVEWGLLEAAPKATRVKEVLEEKVPLTPEEGERLVAAARDAGPQVLVVALLGVDAGLRSSEIRGLRWADIGDGAIVVGNRVWNGQEGPPKGNKTRRLPLTERVREALQAVPRHPTAPHILVTEKGTPIRSSQTLIDWFEPIWERARVPRGIHRLRHTFATDALRAGVPLRVVQRLLGHSSIVTTERYLHALKSDLDAGVGTLERSRRLGLWRTGGEAQLPPEIPS